jgi:hypothetical protein
MLSEKGSRSGGSAGKDEKPWYATQYKTFGMSSILDDWHPDVYKNFDPREWVELISSAGPDAVWLQSKSHSGNAYYITDIDHTHMGLRGEDAFGEMMQLFHERGIKVVANQSILFDNYLYKEHPEWRIRDADGKDSKDLYIGYARPGVLCFNSPYRDLALSQVDAFAKKYRPDGMVFDMVVIWIPVCYCGYCRKLYREERQSDLPAKDDRSSPAYRQYVRWRDNKLYEFTRELVSTYKRYRPDGLATFQGGRPYGDRPSLWYRAPLASITHGDPCQADMSNLSVSFAASLFSNTTTNSPALLALGRFHGSEGQHTGLRSLDELKLSAAFCMANNCGLMIIEIVNADGTLYASPFRVAKKVFDGMRPLESFYGGEKIRSVAVYISEETKNYLYESGTKGVIKHKYEWDKTQILSGVEEYASAVQETFRAFLDHQHPVDVITRLNLDDLEQYGLVVLPEAMCMSSREVERFREYVRGGGNLVATRFTSLYDEDGERKHNFLLADVLGVDYLGETENNETYLKVPPELCRKAGIPDDMEVKVSEQAVVKAHPNTKVLAHIVLPYTNRKNDRDRWVGCWTNPPGVTTDYPAIIMNRYGKGRSCYISFHIHTLDYLFSIEEPRELLYTIASSMLRDVPLSAKNAPHWLLVTGYRKKEEQSIIIHTVNAQQGSRIMPLYDITVELRLQQDEKVSSVTSHPSEENLTFEQEGNLVSFTIPKFHIHQVALIELV